MDDNKSGSLDIQEFWKGLSDFRLPISPDECRQLFTIFDFDDCGEVIYNEFLRAVAGEMSPIRREFCMKAFQKCDKDNSGELELSD